MNSQQAGTADRGPWELRFITNLQRLRERRSLKQTDLARALRRAGLPFHQQTIQRIENGDRPVRLNEAYLIAQELDVELEQMTSSFYSGLGELQWEMKRLLDNSTEITYSLTEKLVDLLSGVGPLLVTIESYLEGSEHNTFAELPEWVKIGLACCYRVRYVIDRYVSLIEELGGFAGDEYGNTNYDEWDFEAHIDDFPSSNLSLIRDLENLIKVYNCQELRDLAEMSGRELLFNLQRFAEKASK